MFWTGILLIILFASMLPIFPVSDMRTAGASELGWSGALDVLHHLVLPACTLGFVYLAQYSRLARASVIEALSADYIRTARARGLPERTVLYKHALRNGVLPVVTMLGLQFGNVLAGAILVETVFNWPGLGRLAFDSVLRRDYPTLLGILLFASLLVVVMNQLTDLAYRLVDPRIKTSPARFPPRRRAPYPLYPSRPFHPQPPWRRRAVATSGRAPVRQSREALRAFLRNPSAVVGLLLLAAVLAVTLFGPALMPADPFEIVSAPMEPPGAEFLLGTDYLGRDVLTGLVHGGRAPAGGRGGGGAVGADRGDGGRAGRLLRRLDRRGADARHRVLPGAAHAAVRHGAGDAVLAVAGDDRHRHRRGQLDRHGAAGARRVPAAQAARYVLAERVIGAGDARIIWRVILPNALAPLIVSATLAVGTAVLFEAGLSFLGLGDPNVMSWG